MKATIYISGIIGTDTTLTDVIRQFKSYEDPTEVEVYINSNGGSVEEGESIYAYLKGLELPVTTIASKAYSIAAQIFQAGETRIIEDIEKAFAIHFPSVDKVSGDAEKLEAVAEYLREIEKRFAIFYSNIIDIDKDTVTALLKNETILSGAEAVEMGFATELKDATKAVAVFNFEEKNNFKNDNKMTKKTEDTKKKTVVKALAEFFGFEIKEEAIALILQDSNGTEIDFPDLGSEDMPKVGDKATIDSSPIPDGEYIIPTMEEATVVFVDGVITEIKPLEETEEEDAIEAEAKIEEEARAEEIKEIAVWEMEVVNTSFAVGDTVEYKYEENTYAVSAGEYLLKDGRRIITDAAGVIVLIKEVDSAEEITVDAEALKKVREELTVEIKAEFQTEIDKQKDELKAIKKLVGSKEFTPQARVKDDASITKKGEKRSLSAIFTNPQTKEQ